MNYNRNLQEEEKEIKKEKKEEEIKKERERSMLL